DGVSVQSALHVRQGRVQGDRAATRRSTAEPLGGVLLLERDRRAHGRAADLPKLSFEEAFFGDEDFDSLFRDLAELGVARAKELREGGPGVFAADGADGLNGSDPNVAVGIV